MVNVVGEISLWNMQFGSRYNPTLRLDSAAATTTAVWVDDMVFICGLSNGSLVTCKLMDSGTVTTKAEFVSALGLDSGRNITGITASTFHPGTSS